MRNKEEQRCLVRCLTLVERKEWLAATVPTAKLNDCISEMWFTREKYSLRTICCPSLCLGYFRVYRTYVHARTVTRARSIFNRSQVIYLVNSVYLIIIIDERTVTIGNRLYFFIVSLLRYRKLTTSRDATSTVNTTSFNIPCKV